MKDMRKLYYCLLGINVLCFLLLLSPSLADHFNVTLLKGIALSSLAGCLVMAMVAAISLIRSSRIQHAGVIITSSVAIFIGWSVFWLSASMPSKRTSIDELGVDKRLLIGCWQNTEPHVLHYGRLFVTDSSLQLSSRADTIFRYRYELREHTLLMIDMLGDSSIAEVEFIDSSQLTFTRLLGKTNMMFLKCAH